MTKYTKINGEIFETINSKKTQNLINWHNSQPRRDLLECYEKPSKTKRAIFSKWCNWAFECFPEIFGLSITSYNTFSFTLGAILYDSEDNLIGYIQITPNHNRLYLI